MKRRIQKVYKSLPPHSNEAHPLTNTGEVSKPFVIAIITVAAIVILSLLLLFSDRLVGKAFYAGEENTAGAVLIPTTAYDNAPFSLKVQANTDVEVSTIGFSLQLPAGMTCANYVGAYNLLGWELESKNLCDQVQNKVIFEYATIGAGKSGTFDVARVEFTSRPVGTYDFDIVSFEAYD